MNNAIDKALKSGKRPNLMTHLVAGYPDLATSRRLIEAMAENGADLIEIQIPFSDPMADGPAITGANHSALDAGIRPDDVFTMVAELAPRLAVPVILMTYANIPFHMGLECFAEKAAAAGANGVIIPDLPFDSDEGKTAIDLFPSHGVSFIPVVSPGMNAERLKLSADNGTGFIYATLRVGTTGIDGRRDPAAGYAFLDLLRRTTSLPLAAGFGISSPEEVAALKGKADIAVVGSRLIRIFETEGVEGVAGFVRKAAATE